MILIPLGVIWAGYALGWYGFTMLKGPGVGFLDLIAPSRIPKVSQTIKLLGTQGASGDSALPANPPSGKNPFTGGSGGPLLPPGIGSNNGPA